MKGTSMKVALTAQRTELTEHFVYANLARRCKHPGNRQVLEKIAAAELEHSRYWQSKTNQEVKPRSILVFRFIWLARLLGLTFALKLMERGEARAEAAYLKLTSDFPEAEKIAKEEDEHEHELLNMLDEESLQYVGSVVLGLNDALVELTGSLAGFTLALANSKVISLAGLVTGISAAFSMAASDYLSSKAENDSRAGKSAIYTGVAYLITVILLILPFLLLNHRFLSLVITLAIAVIIIAAFNFYISVAKDLNFSHRFWEMTLISLGVAAFSFGVGFVLKQILGVNI
jgi:vacuolar iron transporter family protein